MADDEWLSKLLLKYPDLLKKLNAPQHKQSIELLNLRLDSNILFEEYVLILGLTSKEYLEYEFGDMKYSIDEYDKVTEKLNDYFGNSRMDEMKRLFDNGLKISSEYYQLLGFIQNSGVTYSIKDIDLFDDKVKNIVKEIGVWKTDVLFLMQELKSTR